MLYLLLIVFLTVCLLVFLEDYMGDAKLPTYASIAIILVLIATFRVIGNDDDSESYVKMFEGFDDKFVQLTTEPSFIYISSLIHSIGGDIRMLFFIYAGIAVTLKFVAMRQLSTSLFLPLMVYLSHFFILHDMIEIRVSVAIGFFLLAIRPMCERRIGLSLLLLAMAVLFHYSALVLFGLLFLNNKPLTRLWRYGLAAIVPLGYVVYFMGLDLVAMIPIPVIGQKLELYRNMKDFGGFEEILIFKNPTLLIKILVFYLLLFYHDYVAQQNSYLPFLTKIMGLSLFCFFFFSSLPVLSGRLYELFGAVDVITISCLIYIFAPKLIAQSIIMAFSAIMIFMDIFIYQIVRF